MKKENKKILFVLALLWILTLITFILIQPIKFGGGLKVSGETNFKISDFNITLTDIDIEGEGEIPFYMFLIYVLS